MEEVQSVEKREEQRRRWLEELDRQREEMSERRKRDKLLQSQVMRLDSTTETEEEPDTNSGCV